MIDVGGERGEEERENKQLNKGTKINRCWVCVYVGVNAWEW